MNRKEYKNLSTEDLKELLIDWYYLLSLITNYEDEKRLDREIHKAKAILEKRGIYIQEKIVPMFLKT